MKYPRTSTTRWVVPVGLVRTALTETSPAVPTGMMALLARLCKAE